MEENTLTHHINKAINLKFKVLDETHKAHLNEYVFRTAKILVSYYGDVINKFLTINNYTDIYGLIVLLLPYFKLEKAGIVKNLNEIINGNSSLKETLDCTFYIDHENLKIEDYLRNSFKLIEITLFKTAHRFMPNWINIYPLKMENYLQNEIFLNLENLYKMKTFDKENLKMNYTTLYGCLVQFLYNDIKKIKWLIYDVIDNDVLIPTVIYLGDILGYRNFTATYKQLTPQDLNDFTNAWNSIKTNNNKVLKMKSLLLFYYRFNSHKYDDIKMEIVKIFRIEIEKLDYDNLDLEEYINYYSEDSTLLNILHYLLSNISIEEIYTYIYKSIQQLKYTIYGYFCLNGNVIKMSFEFHDKYLSYLGMNTQNTQNKLNYLSPKMIYNCFKNIVCKNKNGKFEPYTNSPDWNELTDSLKIDFIDKLNRELLNIPKNYNNLYSYYSSYSKEDNIKNYNILKNFVHTSNIIPKTIYYCLCYNGILTEFIFKSDIIDEKKMPDKNLNEKLFENHVKSKIDIYGRNFIDNSEYSFEAKKLIIDSGWFLRFGSNWLCQLQQFHHFLHNRVSFITGGTGSGKSTIYPMVMLYSYKAFLFMNNAVIYDTQPRIKPTQENAKRISKQLGYVMNEETINYTQYSTGDSKITDEEYHPTLRFYTDKSIIQIILNNPILKYNEQNIADMILIDESHENNTNMTIILTLLKFATYINNSLSIGMVSATMEYDEVIYRKFYQIIDDNYKYPLDMFLKKDNINRLFMDRRMNMSKPFSDTNYKIDEIIHLDKHTPPNPNLNIYEIVKKILDKKEDGEDIIIFQNGQKDIKNLTQFLLSKELPRHVCILPFYSELTDNERNVVSEISDLKVRNSLRNPQNESQFNHLIPSNKKNNYPYTQFIIIATNIAEASLTIGSLKYVIDTGEHKVKEYNLNTFQSNLKTKKISRQNQIQRKGRVGRTHAGVVYYTYDYTQLNNDPTYKIQKEDFKNIIFELYTSSNEQIIKRINDPNILTNPDKLLNSIKAQYIISDDKLFNYKKMNAQNLPPIIYPYEGKYHSQELIDATNTFYISNPTPYVLDENLSIVRNKQQPENVMLRTFKYLKNMKMFNENSEYDYVINSFGKVILEILKLYDIEHGIELTDLFCILHTFSIQHRQQNKYIELCEYLIHMIIIKIIFSTNSFILDIDAKNKDNKEIKNVKNEFEYKSKFIQPKYYQLYSTHFNHIDITKLKDEKLMYVVKNIIDKLDFTNDDKTYLKTFEEKKEFHKKVLTIYYYHYIIIRHFSSNKLLYGIDRAFLTNFRTDFLCYYNGKNKNEIIFQCLMIKYLHFNIIKKINKTDYIYYKIETPNRDTEIMTLNSYSFVANKNIVLYLNKNDDSEVSNLMTIDEWLIKCWR